MNTAMNTPTNKSWRIDDLTIQRVVEMQMPLRPIQAFLTNLSDEMLAENRGWLRETGGLNAEDLIVLNFQSYIVRTPHHTIVMDTCYGNDKERPDRPPIHRKSDDTYMRGLAAAGIDVNDVDFVVCTHLHVDHVGWNTRLENGRWVPTFPKARYLFSAAELAHWTKQSETTALPHLTDSVLPIVAAGRADLVTSSYELNDHIRLLPTPGHSPDHFAVRMGAKRDAAVMIGDAIHSPLQARYPEISMMADFNPAQAAATRRSVLERYCDTDTLCCTVHFPSPSAGKIKRWGDGFKCEMVSEG